MKNQHQLIPSITLKLRTALFLAAFAGFFTCSSAQGDLPSPIAMENKLAGMFNQLYLSDNKTATDSLNDLITKEFINFLKDPASKDLPLESLDMIGRVHSTDGKLSIFTWYLKQSKGNYQYFGVLKYNTGSLRKPEYGVIPLIDYSRQLRQPETLTLTPEKWLGCVYFNLHTFSWKKQSYYVLFGYDFNNDFSDKKIIEVLTFNKDGNPVFGGDFTTEFQNVRRVILEYSSQLVASVRYDNVLDMIVFDHLSPFEPMFTGNYRFYGPDGSYDGFSFRKGSFLLQKDVDARNMK